MDSSPGGCMLSCSALRWELGEPVTYFWSCLGSVPPHVCGNTLGLKACTLAGDARGA